MGHVFGVTRPRNSRFSNLVAAALASNGTHVPMRNDGSLLAFACFRLVILETGCAWRLENAARCRRFQQRRSNLGGLGNLILQAREEKGQTVKRG